MQVFVCSHRHPDKSTYLNFFSYILTKTNVVGTEKNHLNQGCGNTMTDLSDLILFHSGQVENFNLLVLGQVRNLYKVAKILYFIF